MPVVDEFFEGSNYAEAGLWILIGLIFVGFAVRRRGRVQQLCGVAAVVFLLFGGSDVVEASTGAWWRPWWLLAWKAACVVARAWLLWQYRVLRRSPGAGD